MQPRAGAICIKKSQNSSPSVRQSTGFAVRRPVHGSSQRSSDSCVHQQGSVGSSELFEVAAVRLLNFAIILVVMVVVVLFARGDFVVHRMKPTHADGNDRRDRQCIEKADRKAAAS